MVKRLHVFDSRHKWVPPSLAAARARGWQAQEFTKASEVDSGYVMVFPHAHPKALRHDRGLALEVSENPDAVMVTDMPQIVLYEDKRGQTAHWNHLMPQTWVFTDKGEALEFTKYAEYPLISKADVGASSANVRLIKDRDEAYLHICNLFGAGVKVNHCDGHGTLSVQQGYGIFQSFIPHEVTYRVNAVGRQRAIFYRYCYPDKPMAQTGNVKPAYEVDEEASSLLDWSDKVFDEIGTKWCAIDVLKSPTGWKLLETSLKWPWPSPGDCNNGRFFLDGKSGRKWIELWEVLMDELEAGVWS